MECHGSLDHGSLEQTLLLMFPEYILCFYIFMPSPEPFPLPRKCVDFFFFLFSKDPSGSLVK